MGSMCFGLAYVCDFRVLVSLRAAPAGNGGGNAGQGPGSQHLDHGA